MTEITQTTRGMKVADLRCLTIDNLDADSKLARRLPLDLASRYHALPLTEDNGRITVAMAEPEDTEARDAIVAVLGPSSFVVKGPALAIDARLTEIWGNEAARPLRLGACAYPDPLTDELWAYAQALSALLGANLNVISAPEVTAASTEREYTQCELVIVAGPAHGKRCHPLIQQFLLGSNPGGELPSQHSSCTSAVLVVRRPRWPLERILLVICDDRADNVAVDWALRLARPSAAAITALAVVPPVPAMYRGLSRMEQGVAALLATDTALGRQMHQVARRLAEYRGDNILRLRQGTPDQQIYREMVEEAYDLIVMASRPCPWWLRQLNGDLVCSLLSRVDRPLLLARATIDCPCEQ
jgi:nucleotide-binding universal stress UspA family protein